MEAFIDIVKILIVVCFVVGVLGFAYWALRKAEDEMWEDD